MRIEMLETYLHQGRRLAQGDRVATESDGGDIPDPFGLFLVVNGYAEDVAGEVATGARPTQGVTLEIPGDALGHRAQEA